MSAIFLGESGGRNVPGIDLSGYQAARRAPPQEPRAPRPKPIEIASDADARAAEARLRTVTGAAGAEARAEGARLRAALERWHHERARLARGLSASRTGSIRGNRIVECDADGRHVTE